MPGRFTVLAVFTHLTHGAPAAAGVLDGLLLGLAAPAVFFLTLALTLPAIGLAAFAPAAAAALLIQAITMFGLSRDQRRTDP